MTVWLIIHEEGMWETVEYIRGIYATEALAREARVDRTPGGARSTA